MALAALLVTGWVVVESRHDRSLLSKRLLTIIIPLAAGALFWSWYNYTRFGSPLDTGNLGPDPALDQGLRFDRSILIGLLGLLFSPGRSLFLYVPIASAGVLAFSALARHDRSTAALFGAVCASLLLFYSSLNFWDGLRGYGPRYLVPLLPLLIVPLVWWMAGDWTRRRALSGLIVLSVLVQLAGVVVDFSKVSVTHAREAGGYSRDAKIYSLSESSLVLDARAAIAAVPDNARNLVRGVRPVIAARPASADEDHEFSQRFAFSLDFWWLYLYYLGVIPGWAAVVAGATPFALGCLLLVWASQSARPLTDPMSHQPPG